MLNLFKNIPLLEKLSSQIELLYAYGDNILICTKQGHLWRYQINEDIDLKLVHSYNNFWKRNILQIYPDLLNQILICLSENIIKIYSLDSLKLIETIGSTKGATAFCLNLNTNQYRNLQFCVLVKKKISFLQWENGAIKESLPDIILNDLPKKVFWYKELLLYATKLEYVQITIAENVTKELFPVGKTCDPLICYLHCSLSKGSTYSNTPNIKVNLMALCKDKNTIFYDLDKQQILSKQVVSWSETPMNIKYQEPFFVGLLPTGVEIHTIYPKLFIQKIALIKPEGIEISSSHNKLFVWNAHTLYWLKVSNPSEQINDLITIKQFDLALHIAESNHKTEEEKEMARSNIEYMQAKDLFNNKRYKESMALFSRLKTNPIKVLYLFPSLLPTDLEHLSHALLKYTLTPNQFDSLNKSLAVKISSIDDASSNLNNQKATENALDISLNLESVGEDFEWNSALLALTEYLTECRNIFLASMNHFDNSDTVIEDFLKVVDTCLLKCYSKTNEALIGPLLRLSNNYCDTRVSEKILKKRNRWEELVTLYQRDNFHRRALDVISNNLLAKRDLKVEEKRLYEEKLITYLQHLGQKHIDLIFEYSKNLFTEIPHKALKIFTEEIPEVESLNREAVLYYLIKNSSDSIIPYLEHVIYCWKDHSTLFHNALVNQYRERIQLDLESITMDMKICHENFDLEKNDNSNENSPRFLPENSYIQGSYKSSAFGTIIQTLNDTNNSSLPVDDSMNISKSYEIEDGSLDDILAEDANILLGLTDQELFAGKGVKSSSQKIRDESIKTIEDELLTNLKGPPHNNINIAINSKESEKPLEYYENRVKLIKRLSTVKLVRRKLRKLLEESDYYLPETLITNFPAREFSYERAILFGKMGKHKAALATYIYVLDDIHLALKHCQKFFMTYNVTDIYLELYEVLCSPPNLIDIDVLDKQDHDNMTPQPSPKSHLAQRILLEHRDKLPLLKILEKIPGEAPLSNLVNFLTQSYINLQERLADNEIMVGLLNSKDEKVQEQKYALLNKKMVLTDDISCKLCKKRIGNSAFVHYPDSTFAHYYCYKE